jgi:chromosome partitioning protein
MVKMIATISLKGGVGKTTVTAGVAEFLAGEFGKRVLLIDLDSQINLTTMMIGEKRWFELNESGATLAALFNDAVDGTAHFAVERAVQRSVSPVDRVATVHLLPSSLDLIEVQEELSALRVRLDDTLAAVTILGNAITPIADSYDYILIDCPPNMGPITLNGLAMADGYLIPTIPDVLSTYGIPQIQRRVKEFSDEIGRQIIELGVVITKYRSSSTIHQTTVMRLRRDPSIQNVLPTYLHESNSIAGAAEYRPYGTLKIKYGTHGQFDQFRGLAQNIIVEADDKL